MVRFLKRAYSLDRLRQRSRERREKNENAYENAEASSSSRDSSSSPTFGSQKSMANHCFSDHKPPKSRFSDSSSKVHRRNRPPSDMELMKERFAKLLLGEDMSGGGIGVSSALALSNAITNLAASLLGEQRRLEPMEADTKARWGREISWLVSVTDFIVEFVPSKQVSKDGTTMEIMKTQQREDLRMHIPALRKLDKLLIECLDTYKDQNEFWYASKDEEGNNARREDDKWWLPTVEVPANGLSEGSRRWLHYQRGVVNQMLRAAMAINANVLLKMEIPESYMESLPKKERASLGESLYKSITDDGFEAEQFLSSLDLSTEHKTLDLKNRIEASVVIWRRKMNSKDHQHSKSYRSSAMSLQKREKFEERAEDILLILKHRFPALPQSDLDIRKIQHNKDVGYAIVESYSRIIESRAFTVMSRIENVLDADSLAADKQPTTDGASRMRRRPSLSDTEPVEALDAAEEIEKLNLIDATPLMNLQDFMDTAALRNQMKVNAEDEGRWIKKLPNLISKKPSYTEKIESCEGPRSPASRH